MKNVTYPELYMLKEIQEIFNSRPELPAPPVLPKKPGVPEYPQDPDYSGKIGCGILMLIFVITSLVFGPADSKNWWKMIILSVFLFAGACGTILDGFALKKNYKLKKKEYETVKNKKKAN